MVARQFPFQPCGALFRVRVRLHVTERLIGSVTACTAILEIVGTDIFGPG
jgi:hypothetical protein